MTDNKHSSPLQHTHSAPSLTETTCPDAYGCHSMKQIYRFPLNESRKAQSLSLIRLEVSQKHIRHIPAFRELIWGQLRFYSWKHWVLQGALLLAAMLLSLTLHRQQTDNFKTLTSCSVFLVFAGNICLSNVGKLFSFHMAELEQTLYLNLKQMVCIRMLEAGIADLIILAVFLATTGKSPARPGTSLIYMLAPFLWSDTLYLHMLTSLRSISSAFRSFALGLLCGALALFPLYWEFVYRIEYLFIWQGLTAAGLLTLIAEIYRLLCRIEDGDSMCLN